MDRTAYLDNAATTPMRPEAREAMLPFLGEAFGNPSGSHSVARRARHAVDEAREVVAAALGAGPGDIVFTGSGTEADNLAILGIASGGDVVCAATEHHAVLHAVERAGGAVVPVDAAGVIDVEALRGAVTPNTAVVSVMAVNNEVGTVQPVDRVARIARRRAPSVIVHTDAVQAFSWMDVAELDVDAVTISAHKFGGPKGIGALALRRATAARLRPVIVGGGQERDLRSGTHNVAGIAGMAAAVLATERERSRVVPAVAALRDRLADGLLAAIPGSKETGDRASKAPNICHLTIDGIESEALLVLLDRHGVCGSAGSACASGAIEPSHVLTAMGMPDAEALSSLRLSLGWASTEADIDAAIAAVPACVEQLRA